jgi:hypothetical protein
MRIRTRLLCPAVLLGVLTIVAVLAAACAGSGATTSTSAAATTTSASTTSTTVAATTTTIVAVKSAWGASGTWQDVSLTAAPPQTDPSPELVGDGNKVVYCMVTIKNGSSDPFDYNGLSFTLTDSAGEQYENFGLTSMPDLGEGTLQPGETVEGAVAFEIPQAGTPAGLQWQPDSASAPAVEWGD